VIPPGFAHGFQTLESNCELLYIHSEFYLPEAEEGIHPEDPLLAIEWPIDIVGMSKRDNSFSTIKSGWEGLDIN